MPLSPLLNNDSGLVARTKINETINVVNTISGSTNAITSGQSGFTGSFLGTASWAENNIYSASIPASSNVITFFTPLSSFSLTVDTGSGGGSGTPGGSNTQIQFNSASVFAGTASFAFIYQSQSLQQGNTVTTPGIYSHAQGFSTSASGSYSHAEGSSTTAKGIGSHAEGVGSQTVGQYSHAEGLSTVASGNYSHTEGRNTTAIGQYSHAEGDTTQAVGTYSHAEGEITQSSGSYSHAEGSGTIAKGYASHAEGEITTAIGDYSHTEGLGTVSSGSYQHVQGRYNLSSSALYAFIIGNGTSDSTRSNLIFASSSTFQISGSLIVSGAAESGGSGHLITYNTSSGLLTYTASSAISSPQLKSGSFGATMDGNGGTLTPGEKGYLAMPCSGTLVNWAIAVDQTQGTPFTINLYTSSFTEFQAGNSGSLQSLQLPSSTRIHSGSISVPFTDRNVITFRVPAASTTITRATVTINYLKS